MLARGIHRRLVAFLLVAMLMGVAAGAALHAGLVTGPSVGLLCLGLAIAWAIWPLAWMATIRIAWPLRELADVATELRTGHLQRREALPTGPGEVGEVGEALKGMADRVAQQLQDQRALLAAVSHELRSPLARARFLVEMAREGSAPPTWHDDLQAEIDAMDGLVGDLLARSRIDFEAVAPTRMASAELARRALQIAAIEVEPSLDDPGEVDADPTLMGRALASLLDNARRHGGQVVRFGVRGRAGRVRFFVEDDGKGFAPGDEIRAFEPFWRGDAKVRGEGLGLALVRQVAAAHRGEAGAENRAEGGARVWIELPRAG